MKRVVLFLIAFLFMFLPRIPGISSFSTVDEPDYIKYGGNFYYSIGQRDFDKTLQTYQPAVTTLYASAIAYHLVAPEYRGFGQGYFEDTIPQTDYLERKGIEPVKLLYVARLIMILMVSIMLTTSFALLDKLLGIIPSIIIILLISFEPYFLGHSRLLTQEGLMAISVITSILGIIVYCTEEDKWIFLFISAIAGAIAVITKLTAIVLLPIIVFLLLFISRNTPNRKKQTTRKLSGVIIWSFIFLTFILAVWPAMWNHPIDKISSLFETSFGFLGSKRGVPIESLSLQGIVEEISIINYLKSIWWQVPPLTWFGFLLAIFFLVLNFKKNSRIENIFFFSFLALALLMIAMMSLGKKTAAHYIMVSHVSISFLAGLGISNGIKFIRNTFKDIPNYLLSSLIVFLIIGSQLIIAYSYFPYYFDYLNPLALTFRGDSPIIDTGYGQGLDQAAKYLSQKPNSDDLTVLSWWSPSLDYFFPGKTEKIWITRNWRQKNIDILMSSDYLVIYYKTQMTRKMPEGLIDILEFVKPEKNISIHGVDMVRIYKVSDLPIEVFIPSIVDP